MATETGTMPSPEIGEFVRDTARQVFGVMGHQPTDHTNPPPRRLGAVVLVRDSGSRILLVHPTYKDGWILPGGSADAGGSIAEAA
ncbi:NUDIX domain-containing protein, partial [Streptomyces lycii]